MGTTDALIILRQVRNSGPNVHALPTRAGNSASELAPACMIQHRTNYDAVKFFNGVSMQDDKGATHI
ncbi:MAG: hypothetical protein PVJ19_22525 [Desulfobacteraceae bacterium]|jgi:hypothetical protein